LRLFLVLRFPTTAGDSPIYETLAANWLDAHIYGLCDNGRIAATDIRGPGYPAFLAALYLVVGRGERVILLAQAVLDLATCLIAARLAAAIAPERRRSRAATVALWLAATCPLVANYAAVPLTETLATFLTAASLLVLACALSDERTQPDIKGRTNNIQSITASDSGAAKLWFAGSFLVGLGTLVRPETPLVLAALAAVLVWRWRRPPDWGRLVRVGALAGAGLVVALLPWGARNWGRFHEVQFLAPVHAAGPEEFVPRGFSAWTATWLVRYRDVYLVSWKVDSDPINLADIPPAAFDDSGERDRVGALLDSYNETTTMTPEIDGGFQELARERTARHPLRTYLGVPAGRVATLWLTPRVELLPISGHLVPLEEQWREDPAGFSVTVAAGALNIFYLGVAVVGLARVLGARGIGNAGTRTVLAFLIAFIVLRTVFLTQVETPEPRYVLECFPALWALGEMAWSATKS
jgi:hypothetical protein